MVRGRRHGGSRIWTACPQARGSSPGCSTAPRPAGSRTCSPSCVLRAKSYAGSGETCGPVWTVRSWAGTAHHWSGRSTTGAAGPVSRTRARRSRKAAIPAAPCIHEVPGGSKGGSRRCSMNRQRAPAWSRIARPARASAIVRADRSSLSARAGSVQSCAASSSTSPTPAVPQQRPSLSQKPGRSRCGTPEARIESRHRCRSHPTGSPATSSTPAAASAANSCEVPAGPWHQV